MASTANLRSRRSAAQLHALAGVEREIRAQDSRWRRKYLREFCDAFGEYDFTLTPQQLREYQRTADIVLIGDYHSLPAAQRYAATLLEQRALEADRTVVLSVEAIFSRDQHVVDEWWRRQIDESELRRRLRFDADWGYEWAPFYELLVAARDHGEAIYGLDCMPRGDLRQASIHDRHAGERLAEIERRHPNSILLVLFGESHLAPSHLPLLLRQRFPEKKLLTVLQNVDALYWRLAGESGCEIPAVRVQQDVVCVFNATPLEKYESYRLCLDRWSDPEPVEPDFTPAAYNLIHSLVRFMRINFYSPHNGTQPKFLVDLLPEVYSHPDETALRKRFSRAADEETVKEILRGLDEWGSIYLASTNTLFIREFRLPCVSRQIGRFLHHACRGLPQRGYSGDSVELNAQARFCSEVLEGALVHLSTRVLCPIGIAGSEFSSPAAETGLALGNALYDAYVEARVSRPFLRRLFLARIEEPGVARATYLEAGRKVGARLPSLHNLRH
jgi:hypothetical protein